jgi:hypothetical protein
MLCRSFGSVSAYDSTIAGVSQLQQLRFWTVAGLGERQRAMPFFRLMNGHGQLFPRQKAI